MSIPTALFIYWMLSGADKIAQIIFKADLLLSSEDDESHE